MSKHMITIECGRPSELIRSLRTFNPASVYHLRIMTQQHFWYTNDRIHDTIQELVKLPNLRCIEFNGDSYPSLADTVEFLMFLSYNTCNLRDLTMPIQPPFPGQYPIRDRNFLVNKLLHVIFTHQSLYNVKFYSPSNSLRHPDSENDWTNSLNMKIKSLIRNHQNKADSKL